MNLLDVNQLMILWIVKSFPGELKMKCLQCKSKMILIETKNNAVIKCEGCSRYVKLEKKEETIKFFNDNKIG